MNVPRWGGPARPLFLGLAALMLLAAACGTDSDTDDAATAAGTDPAAAGTSDDATDDSTENAGDETADGSDETADGSDDGVTGGFPVTIESAGGTWTLEAPPQRIVSLSPTATEILFAIGAGDRVVAADAFSNHPPEAPTTELSGFDPNLEAITGWEPDLVVIANDANDLVAGLTALDIPVLVSPAPIDLEQGYDEMAALGIATGNVDETAAVVAQLRADLDEALASGPGEPVRVYHELDENYFAASSDSFIGAVYETLGLSNIADEADVDGTGFPQLTEEYIVEADPELIVITDQVTYTVDDVLARPGWGEVSAVEDGNVVVVEADTASRWGPRLPQFVAEVADALHDVVPASDGY